MSGPKVLASANLGDDLLLKLTLVGGAPAVVISNAHTGRKQMRRPYWFVEGLSQLKVKRGASLVEYSREEVLAALTPLLKAAAQDEEVRGAARRAYVAMLRVAHDPHISSSLERFRLADDLRRSSLWFSQGRGSSGVAFLLPLFLLREEEELFRSHFSSIWDGRQLRIAFDEDLSASLFRAGVPQSLALWTPSRWNEPLVLSSAAAFFCLVPGGEERILFPRSLMGLSDVGVAEALSHRLLWTLRSFMRFFPLAPHVGEFEESFSFADEVDAFLRERGFSPRRRWQEPMGVLGDWASTLTLYESGERTAISLVPELPEGSSAWSRTARAVWAAPEATERMGAFFAPISVDPLRESALYLLGASEARRWLELWRRLLGPFVSLL